MNQEIRNTLRNVVTQCRKLLDDSISQELEGKYGIFAKKDHITADPNAKMIHLTEEEQAARKDILDHFGHIKARGFKPREALDQLVREIAFTHLNRLCAYKMMEAREVYVGGQKFREAVSRGINSNGVKFYLADHPEEERLFNTGHQDVAYRHFLDWLGGLLSDEIGVLFNPNDPANRLYPRQKILDEVLELLNGGGVKPEEVELREEWAKIWSQDESIGWVYQYFTPKELRDQARKESAAPRNSYELAFRNQFFTPRYVVEFLTDNTLGRIWYEMRKGDTTLKDQCRYMVRRPTEVFLTDGERPPEGVAGERDDLSQEELLKLPVYVPHRSKKDPRELKCLDPACGSGHFLLYCFDLLLTIYDEAYADPDLGPPLQKDYPTLEDLRRDAPRLILAHNLHGIDIDMRCSQIAALALWLRCQRAFQEMELKTDRPKITRSNFVCAEPMPGEEHMLKEFVSQLQPKLLGHVVEVVFDKMKLAGEAGSLLKIEDELRDAVAAAKKQWVRETTQATDRKGQPLLFTQGALDRIGGKPDQSSLFDLTDISDDQFFEQAEAMVIDALRQYAEKAQNDQRLQRRLFTEDAVRGFAFVDLFQQRYDVVLMNPPFTAASEKLLHYTKSVYPNGYYNLGTSFYLRFDTVLNTHGIMGSVLPRQTLAGSRLEYIRHLILKTGQYVLDLGGGVFDQQGIEAIGVTSEPSRASKSTLFIDGTDTHNKGAFIRDTIYSLATSKRAYLVPNNFFSHFAKTSLAPYCFPPSVARRLWSLPKLDPQHGETAAGQMTGDDFRYLRLYWEIPVEHESKWRFFAKGGDYSRYCGIFSLVVDWSDSAVTHYRTLTVRSVLLSRRKDDFVGKPGLTWSRVSDLGFAVRWMPPGTMFSEKGPVFFPKAHPWFYQGLLNSEVVDTVLRLQDPGVMFELRTVASLPIPIVSDENIAEVENAARELFEIKWRLLASEETNPDFVHPLCDVRDVHRHSLREQFELWHRELERLTSLHQQLSEKVTHLFGLSQQTIDLVRGEFPTPPLEGDLTSQQIFPYGEKSVAANLLSWMVGHIFGRWRSFGPDTHTLDNGSLSQGREARHEEVLTKRLAVPCPMSDEKSLQIVVDDVDHQDDIVRRVGDALEDIWSNGVEAIEKEACEIVGVKELRDYFRKPGKGGFWDDHVSRYSKSRRNAPIYWLLQSSKKNYALWLYYHRLDKDLLFKAMVNYVEPKIRLETSRLETFCSQKGAAGESGKEAKRLANDVERQEDFLSELRDFEDKLRRAANLHLEPDLNDGVVLNIAPLHELVPWKEAKSYWEELLNGKYEWSSIGRQLRQKGLVK